MIRRPRRLAAIVLGVAVFLVISGILARWLTVEDAERNDILQVLIAEAHGNAAGMLAQLYHCDSHCQLLVHENAHNLRRSGRVLILADQSATAYALTSTTGATRVAWKAGNKLPVVQCFTVSRKGNAISGLTVRLLGVSLPIGLQSDC